MARVEGNGRHPAATSDRPRDDPSRRFRFVFFGESIVSDWGNPAATSARAILRNLGKDGHEAVFLEQRRNRAVADLLRARGSAALRAFAAHYPDLHHRTYDLPAGLERTLWFVRQAATVDAVVVLEGAPDAIFEEAARLNARQLVRAVWTERADTGWAPWADLRLTVGTTSSDAVAFGPAVERVVLPTGTARAGTVVVAYDDTESAATTRSSLDDRVRAVSAGSVAGSDWTFVPEVELPGLYARSRLAVIAGAGEQPLAAARPLLAVASGCPAVVIGRTPPLDLLRPVVRGDELADLAETVAALEADDAAAAPVTLPARFDAALHARRLVGAVRDVLRRRLG